MADRAPSAKPLTAAALALWLLAAGAVGARAVQPDEMLADPGLEARARAISAELRCLVCQNQPIDESDADLARDLRLLVRERLKAGDSNEQVIDYIVSRYGDFVLLRPPFKSATYALWLGPGLVLAIGLSVLIAFYRRGTRPVTTATAPLSNSEEEQLTALLRDQRE